MQVKLLTKTENILDTMYVAARTCYSAESPIEIKVSDEPFKLIKKVLDGGHLSIAENISFTFAIEGVSRALLAQITRHRVGVVFQVQSQRYVEFKDGKFDFVMPNSIVTNQECRDYFYDVMDRLSETYKFFIEHGIKPEDARYVLPNACTTNITMSCNLRELMHICNLRMCARAQHEIREMVTLMANEVIKVVPEFKEYLVPNCEKLGFCPEHNGCGRKEGRK